MLKIVNKKSSDSTKNKTEKVKERESKITGLNLDDGAKKKASKKTNKQTNKKEKERTVIYKKFFWLWWRKYRENSQKNLDSTKTREKKLVPKESNVSETTRKNRLQTFADGEACSMVHLSILETGFFIFKEECKFVIRKRTAYVCDIC